MKRRTLLQSFSLLSLPSLTAILTPMAPPYQTVTNRIEQARQAWLQGNGPAFADLFTADGRFIVPGQHWQGRAAILQAFQDFTATHSVQAIAIQNLVVQGNHALLEWLWEDIDHQTGQVTTAADAIAVDFQGELICRWREYIDSSSGAASQAACASENMAAGK